MRFGFIHVVVMCLVCCSATHGQQQPQLKGYERLPLLNDSVKGFQHLFSQIDKIRSIKESDALFELRYYRHPERGYRVPTLYQLKLSKAYMQRTVYTIMYQDGGYYGYEILPTTELYKDSLLNNGFIPDSLYNLRDQREVIDSIRKLQPIYYHTTSNGDLRCLHCGDTYSLVEIKHGDNYSSFFINSQADWYYFFNSEHMILKPYAELRTLIRNILQRAVSKAY